MAVKVLVIDDSPFFRTLVAQVLGSIEGAEYAGGAGTCDDGVREVRIKRPDLVLCDVHMPGHDGVETLALIKREFPEMTVVMMSGTSQRNADETVRALQLGAFDFIRKPSGTNEDENFAKLKSELAAMVRLTAISINARAARKTASTLQNRSRDFGPITTTIKLPSAGNYQALLIGSSTGGPEALGRLLPSLPQSFPLPVVVAQHMPAHFTDALARSLDRKTRLRVVEAQDGQPIRQGYIYVAQGGRDMQLARRDGAVVCQIRSADPALNCHPNVNTLFASAADVYAGSSVLAVVLTGMGDDGVEGVRALKRQCTCHCIVQSASTCVVFGMPRAVAEAGLSDMVLPLENIGIDVDARVRLAGVLK